MYQVNQQTIPREVISSSLSRETGKVDHEEDYYDVDIEVGMQRKKKRHAKDNDIESHPKTITTSNGIPTTVIATAPTKEEGEDDLSTMANDTIGNTIRPCDLSPQQHQQMLMLMSIMTWMQRNQPPTDNGIRQGEINDDSSQTTTTTTHPVTAQFNPIPYFWRSLTTIPSYSSSTLDIVPSPPSSFDDGSSCDGGDETMSTHGTASGSRWCDGTGCRYGGAYDFGLNLSPHRCTCHSEMGEEQPSDDAEQVQVEEDPEEDSRPQSTKKTWRRCQRRLDVIGDDERQHQRRVLLIAAIVLGPIISGVVVGVTLVLLLQFNDK